MSQPVVVLLHGLGRTRRSMAKLRVFLEQNDYTTWSRTYPSRRLGVEKLAETVAGWIREDLGDAPVIGVTHSLGGILARHMAGDINWQGLLMLAPPNAGSQVAARLRPLALYRWLFGPAGQEVADPTGWPAPPDPFAVIAGTRGASFGNVPSWLVSSLRILPPSEPHDGTVTAEETRLDGMTAYAEVDASHTWLMNHPRARELILEFLARRTFDEQA